MDDKEIIENEFNKIAIQFLEQGKALCDRMNNDSICAGDIIQLETAVKMKRNLIITFASVQLLQYKKYIDNNDFSFIEKFDLKSLRNANMIVIKKYLSYIKLFKKLNPDNKRILFDYLKIFSDLVVKYEQITQVETIL